MSHYASISAAEWEDMGGINQMLRKRHEKLYGVPIATATISLGAVIRWLHSFLSDLSAGKRSYNKEEDTELSKLRGVKTKLEELKLERELGMTIPREQVHHTITRVASILRRCGGKLREKFGDDAADILNDALDEIDEEAKE